MSVCPICGNEEPEGMILCSRCGCALHQEGLDSEKTLTISGLNTSELLQKLEGVVGQSEKPAKTGDSPQVALILVDSDTAFELSGKNEYTLGRVTEGQAGLPDVDLSTYEAYAQGVSRQHAIIRISDDQVIILDLNSSNGTRINGQKVIPHVDYFIHDGDIVALGKLRIQVIIH